MALKYQKALDAFTNAVQYLDCNDELDDITLLHDVLDKYLRALPPDDFPEERRSVFNELREKLKHLESMTSEESAWTKKRIRGLHDYLIHNLRRLG